LSMVTQEKLEPKYVAIKLAL